MIALLAGLCCCFAFIAIAIMYRKKKKQPEEEEEDERLGAIQALELGHASSMNSGVSLNSNPLSVDGTHENKTFES